MKRLFEYCFYFLFVFSACYNYSCHSEKQKGDGREGKIIYSVQYEDKDSAGAFAGILPDEMILFFKHDKMRAEFSMAKGMVKTSILSDAGKKTFSTLLEGIGNKKALVLDSAGVQNNFKDRVPLKIVFTENTKEIAGIICHEANVTDSTDHTYTIYYTKEIAVTDPNWSNPFSGIDGVLMDYTIKFNSLVLTLRAKEVSFEKVEDKIFNVPSGYKIINNPSDFM